MRGFALIASGFAVPFLTAGLLSAAEPTPAAGKNVESLLRKLSNAFVTKDVETIRLLMSKDHVAILNNGHRKTGEEELNSLADLNLTEYTMDHVKVAMPTKDMVIVTYQAHQEGTWKGMPLPLDLMVSSVWANQNGKWLEVLYQETPVGIK